MRKCASATRGRCGRPDSNRSRDKTRPPLRPSAPPPLRPSAPPPLRPSAPPPLRPTLHPPSPPQLVYTLPCCARGPAPPLRCYASAAATRGVARRRPHRRGSFMEDKTTEKSLALLGMVPVLEDKNKILIYRRQSDS
ncbi:late cornified envelope-like proline-rich protein 1 [Phacochoerus africanus]|uniref:late cornified envelope-like proline-rich protein 1 n=1 Tax=Phacochoerus africanus TaxID=41426 RepID=UPI001FDA5399|nr:late cornified envelope-like proline-rich protein 1 [Phacochoerus africanus]